MKIEPKVIITRNEAERVQKLGEAFREFLGGWFAMLIMGVRFSPEVARELALALCEYAASALIATSDAAEKEPDEETAERSRRAAREAVDVISREVLS